MDTHFYGNFMCHRLVCPSPRPSLTLQSPFFMTFTFYRLTPLVLRTAKTPRPPPKNIKGFSKSQKTQISLSAKSGSCNNVKTNGPLMMKLGEWTDRLFSGDYTHLFYFVH